MPDYHHPRRRFRGRPLGVERAQARDEALGIPAPVGVMRPDELPPEPPGFRRPLLTADAPLSFR